STHSRPSYSRTVPDRMKNDSEIVRWKCGAETARLGAVVRAVERGGARRAGPGGQVGHGVPGATVKQLGWLVGAAEGGADLAGLAGVAGARVGHGRSPFGECMGGPAGAR